MAMLNGWVYLADEYDFALPSVLAVYQPVLEGKALVIKEAPAAQRIVRPHPNFRFIATGNTNGSGDETGLYQGTNIQNAANYDRFHMVLEIKYMKAALETQILVNQAKIDKADAEKLVDFANRVRESYDGNKISSPISPRTLIAAAQIGLRKGSYRAGISLCFANKLSKVDKEVVNGPRPAHFWLIFTRYGKSAMNKGLCVQYRFQGSRKAAAQIHARRVRPSSQCRGRWLRLRGHLPGNVHQLRSVPPRPITPRLVSPLRRTWVVRSSTTSTNRLMALIRENESIGHIKISDITPRV